jgi:hypothetical protein
MKSLIPGLFLTLSLTTSMWGQYTSPENIMPPRKKLSISNVELISSGILIGGGFILPRVMNHTQGLEVPMFVFGITLGLESIRLRNTIPNIRQVKMERRLRRIRRRT